MSARAKESLTISNSAVGLTSTNYVASGNLRKVDKVVCTLESAQIRFWVDGSTPTATVGHILNPGETLTLENYDEVRKFLAIRTGTVDATLRATFDG
jgi:hypothetical protein